MRGRQGDTCSSEICSRLLQFYLYLPIRAKYYLFAVGLIEPVETIVAAMRIRHRGALV